MSAPWGLAIIIAMFAVFLGGIPWLASRARRHGVGVSVLEPIQEMWDPTVHREQIEFHAQLDRKAPAPSPDDPPWDQRFGP